MRCVTKVVGTHHVTGDQVRFDTIKEAAKFAKMKSSTLAFRIKTRSKLLDGNGYHYEMIEPTEEELLRRVKRKEKQTERVFRSDDAVLDTKYRIVTYQTRNLRECITPCPYRDNPKPMIGSVNCVRCSSFRGRNKVTHQVACNRSNL